MRRLRGAKLVVYLQDIYPDIAVALGKLPDNFLTRWLRRAMFAVYRRADRVVVLSRDMHDRLATSGVPAERIACVSNWVDTTALEPRKQDNPFRRKHDVVNQFVVMYSGNLGSVPAVGRHSGSGPACCATMPTSFSSWWATAF